MAEFCAQFDVANLPNRNDVLQQALFKGHRGYISYADKELAKEFDKRIEELRAQYSVMKKFDDEEKANRGRYYHQSEKFIEITIFYEEGVHIADEVFEEEFLR